MSVYEYVTEIRLGRQYISSSILELVFGDVRLTFLFVLYLLFPFDAMKTQSFQLFFNNKDECYIRLIYVTLPMILRCVNTHLYSSRTQSNIKFLFFMNFLGI